MEKITIIKPKKGIRLVNIKELYEYRELLTVLALKDIKVRYKQTIFGGLWAIAQPLITMVVFSIFFGEIANVPSEGVPYPAFSYSGLLIWIFFVNSVNLASSSLLSNVRLITKVYFPRIIIPLSTTLVSLVDYLVSLIILFGIMFYYQIPFSNNLLFIPLIVFVTWLLAIGMGLLFSAINVKYRDVKYVIPFFLQLLIFLTPVIYPVSIAGKFRWILYLNPMSGIVEAHRALILGHQAVNLGLFLSSFAISLLIFIVGLIYFKSTERYFADII
jgi:lipopolysaccharide transport system permease protein